MGLGAFPAPHEQWLGMLGMHGTRAANYAMDEADLIVAIGARFDDRITGKLSEFAPRAKFIHIDIDPAEISKNVPAHIPIVGDAKNILAAADRRVPRARRRPGRGSPPGGSGSSGWREQHPLRYDDSQDTEIKPQFMVQALYEATGGDCILASDVGQHQMWAAQYFHFAKPRRWINSGGLGTMGFGLPAAMGAAVGCPDVPTVPDRRRRVGPDEHPGAGDAAPSTSIPVKVVHHEQRLPGHGPPVAGAVLGPALLARRHGLAGPTSSSSPRPTAATGMRLTDKTTLVEDMQRGDRDARPGGGRRPRHARGEHVPDDRARRRRAGHGGLSAWASPGPRSC